MGYTHYWKRPLDMNAEGFKLFAEDVRRIISLRSAIIQLEEDDDSDPITNGELVHFNGIGINAHEPFYIQRIDNALADSCKTNRKPYDEVVVACLIALKHRVPNVILSSDGNYDEITPGWELACDALNIQENLTYYFTKRRE